MLLRQQLKAFFELDPGKQCRAPVALPRACLPGEGKLEVRSDTADSVLDAVQGFLMP